MLKAYLSINIPLPVLLCYARLEASRKTAKHKSAVANVPFMFFFVCLFVCLFVCSDHFGQNDNVQEFAMLLA